MSISINPLPIASKGRSSFSISKNFFLYSYKWIIKYLPQKSSLFQSFFELFLISHFTSRFFRLEGKELRIFLSKFLVLLSTQRCLFHQRGASQKENNFSQNVFFTVINCCILTDKVPELESLEI